MRFHDELRLMTMRWEKRVTTNLKISTESQSEHYAQFLSRIICLT